MAKTWMGKFSDGSNVIFVKFSWLTIFNNIYNNWL